MAVLDDRVATAEDIEVDVVAVVDADLARGDYHHSVLEARQVRGAVHAPHDDQAAVDVLDGQARERHVGRRGRHIHDAAVEVC